MRDRIDFIMRLFSDAFHDGHAEALEWLVSGLDPKQLETQEIVTVLTCANWPAIPAPDIDGGFVRGMIIGDTPRGDLIPSRHVFAKQARDVLAERLGPERAIQVLRGLA